MKNQKILVDREPLSKEFIQSKQDFENVLSHVKNLKPPVWKTPWFYGPVGLAVVAVTLSSVKLQPVIAKTALETDNQYEKVISIENRKIEVETIAISSPTKLIENSVREKKSHKKVPTKITEVKIENIEDIELEKVINDNDVVDISTSSESKKKISFPNINGTYTGEVSIESLRSPKGITCGNVKVKSFTIQYYNGRKEIVRDVQGNTIPTDVCDLLEKYNWGSNLFITNIKGVNENGKAVSLPSMNLIPH